MLQPFQVKEVYNALMDAGRDIMILKGALDAVNEAIENEEETTDGEDLEPQEEEHDLKVEEIRDGSVSVIY